MKCKGCEGTGKLIDLDDPKYQKKDCPDCSGSGVAAAQDDPPPNGTGN